MHLYTPMYKGLLRCMYDFLAQKRQIQHLARAIPITILPQCQFHIDLFPSEPEVFLIAMTIRIAAFASLRVSLNR